MIKIAIAGGPGSGKLSLARQLITELYNHQQRNAQLVTEFARDYINACRHQQDGEFHPSLADQLLIYHSQLEREAVIPQKAEFLITDSPAFLPIIFASNMCDRSSYQQRTIFLHMYGSFFTRIDQSYDLVIMLDREKPFLKDGTRGEDEQQADDLGRQIRAFLDLHGMPYHDVKGPDEVRVLQVLKFITGIEVGEAEDVPSRAPFEINKEEFFKP